jgi:hypothetical protein
MGTFVNELKTMAIPLAPPHAMLCGIRNETRPTAVKTAPMVDKRYSLKIFLNMSSPPESLNFLPEGTGTLIQKSTYQSPLLHERRVIIAWNAF